jgi:hypothetical protein
MTGEELERVAQAVLSFAEARPGSAR